MHWSWMQTFGRDGVFDFDSQLFLDPSKKYFLTSLLDIGRDNFKKLKNMWKRSSYQQGQKERKNQERSGVKMKVASNCTKEEGEQEIVGEKKRTRV